MSAVVLIMMVGFPRSGKSTWIRDNKNNELVIEPDWIRRNILGHQFHKPAEPIIWLIADSFIRVCLAQDRSVILDGTNLHPFVRMKYIELAKESNVDVGCVWVQTPIEVCVERNKVSEEGQKLPEDALIGKAETFEKPTMEEGFDWIEEV